MIFIKQQDQTDCGPACLVMMASYYKTYYDIGKVRQFTKTDIYGTTISGMVEGAKKIGFDVVPIKATINDIKPDIEVPFIAHVSIIKNGKNIRHFVVVKKVSKHKILLYDPSVGKVKVSNKRFLDTWTGIVLIFRKNAQFTISKKMILLLSLFCQLLGKTSHP